MTDKSSSAHQVTGVSHSPRIDIGTRVLLGTAGLIVLGWLSITLFEQLGGSLPVAAIAVAVSAAYCLAAGMRLRSWGWLSAPWVAALLGIIAYAAFIPLEPELGLGLTVVVLAVILGAWAAILSVASGVGVWLGKRQTEPPQASPPFAN